MHHLHQKASNRAPTLELLMRLLVLLKKRHCMNPQTPNMINAATRAYVISILELVLVTLNNLNAFTRITLFDEDVDGSLDLTQAPQKNGTR